jgi:hypothetical protein
MPGKTFAAGLTQSMRFLPHVAGDHTPRPWDAAEA